MANEYFIDHICFIIGLNEGSIRQTGNDYGIIYDLIELGEPYEGIGIGQWSFGRSFDLLRDIYVALGNNFGGTTPPSDIQTAVSGNNRWTSYKWKQNTDATNWVRKFLRLDEAKTIQTQKFAQEIQEYTDTLNSQGLSNLKARGYAADVGHQYGMGWGRKWGGARYNSSHNSLDAAHKATPQTYRTRRNRTYKYLQSANFDNPAPVTYDYEQTNAEGQQDPGSPRADDGDIVEKTIANKMKEYQKISNTYVTKQGETYYNKYFAITPTTGYRKNFTTMFVKTLVDLFELIGNIPYEDYENTANQTDEDDQTNLDNTAQNEHDNIGDYNQAIQKAVAKANSYPDGSVQYSMTGKRDMKSSGDCSCFTEICFKAGGINLGGWSGAQYATCKKLGKIVVDGNRSVISQIVSQAQPGDIVFMGKNASGYVAGGASHVGIIVGTNQFRHQSSGGGVTGKKGVGPQTDPLDQYLQNYLGTSYVKFSLGRPLS